ncbi:hypothetical protein A3I82_01600 [Candidatus Azambacteria bacterium RIFCSPLOWO2_02_FULL_42_10]|nr:MAG: hypothetical protein A3I82_01600 [Candidatus Azambacteria bacterium RIFCSPLOWO2_02_FULL_42_10]
MSLLDPTKKMSKSGGEKSYIALTDFPEIIQEKIKSAVSDTGGGKDKRGGENLLEIFNAFAETKNGQSEYSNYKRYHEEGTLKYAEFKPALAELISNYFADYRAKRAELLENPDFVKNVLTEGNKKTSAIAEATLQEVKQKLGLII